jgi:hypothetical protein
MKSEVLLRQILQYEVKGAKKAPKRHKNSIMGKKQSKDFVMSFKNRKFASSKCVKRKL